ncbi:hypothetical protein B0H65DRAFT_444230 [Neurospora tetraspora]|uniref:F-box domain-containing protein n=1 Tax=Neurospora tetraspora TaxID=94610 RepID=A0AAE0JAP8_9PEZI|nr:hypothetical protein B0H65DRAFT_444230 [Neurospora tetraspora]
MASESKPPLLAAPLEIRHIIYRYVWTIPIDADKHLERYFPSCLNENYFKLQFGQIHALVSICQQMRDEVLAEYFPRTQVYLRSHHRHVFDRHRLLSGYYESHRGHFWDQESHRRGFDLRSQVRNGRPHFDAIHYIIRPPLFTQNTQHVSLLWKRCFCPKDMTPEDIETSGYHAPLDWLLKLGQLKTLELVIADPDIRTFEALRMLGYGTWTSLARILPCRNCFSKLLRLRNLEKVVFKPLFDDPTVGHIQGPEVNRPNWVARIKKEVSDTILRKDPNQLASYVVHKGVSLGSFGVAGSWENGMEEGISDLVDAYEVERDDHRQWVRIRVRYTSYQ